MSLKINLEAIFLIVFCSAFLFLGVANLWDNKLSHEYPYAYLASDSFLHHTNAEFVKKTGTIKYVSPATDGGYKDVYNPHPPALFELSAAFSFLSGLETYDTIYFVTVFMCLFGILALYLVIRQFNVNVAILALPVTLLIFSKYFNMGMFWGIWHFILGISFMLAVFWCFSRIELKSMYLVMAVILAANLVSHLPEAVFILGFMILFIVYESIANKKLKLEKIKPLFLAGIIAVVIAINYVVIFFYTYFLTEGFRGTPATGNFGFPPFYFQQLGYVGIVMAIGLIIFLLVKKKAMLPAFFGIYFFIVSYLTYLGFGKRAFTHRFFWHTYLAIFFGLAIYYILKLIIKRWNKVCSIGLATAILVFFVFELNPITKIGNEGIMNPYTWQGLKWISENTPEDERIYYFYSDTFLQSAALYESERVSLQVGKKSYVNEINTGKLLRVHGFGLADAWETLLCKRGVLDFGFYKSGLMPENGNFSCEKGFEFLTYPPAETDLCDIRYMYFEKGSAVQPPLAQYNIAIAKELLKNDWIKVAYENPLVVILENKKPGVDCLAEDI